jgi:hypothetical protein
MLRSVQEGAGLDLEVLDADVEDRYPFPGRHTVRYCPLDELDELDDRPSCSAVIPGSQHMGHALNGTNSADATTQSQAAGLLLSGKLHRSRQVLTGC